MQKFKFPVLALILIEGIAGFVIRYIMLDTVYDDYTGLPERGSVITAMLFFAAGIVILAALIISFTAGKREITSYTGVFRCSGGFGVLVSIIAGVAVIAGTLLQVLSGMTEETMKLSDMIFGLLGFVSGISMIVCGGACRRGNDSGGLRIVSVIPAVFLCIWLVFVYRDNSSNAVLLDFACTLLALAFSTLYFYYSAGFAFGKNTYRRTLFCGNVSFFLCCTAAADTAEAGFPLILLAIAAYTFAGVYGLLSYSPVREKQREAVPEE